MKNYIFLAMMSFAIQGVRHENNWFTTEKEAQNYVKTLKYTYETNITKLRVPGIGTGYAVYAAINDKSEQLERTKKCLKERIEVIKQSPIGCKNKTTYEIIKEQNAKRRALSFATAQANAAITRIKKMANLDEIQYQLTLPSMKEYDKSGKSKLSAKGKLLALHASNEEVESEQWYRECVELRSMDPEQYISRFAKLGKPWTAEMLQRISNTKAMEDFFEYDLLMQRLEAFSRIYY